MKPNQRRAVSMLFFQTINTLSWVITVRLHRIPGFLGKLTEKALRAEPGLCTGQYLKAQCITVQDLFQVLTMASLIRLRTERVDSTFPLAIKCILPSILD